MTAEHPEFEEYLSKIEYDRELSVMNNSQGAWYGQLVTALIRLSYDANAEIALLRQKDEKPDDYADWYQYAEDAKDYAYVFVYGQNRRNN